MSMFIAYRLHLKPHEDFKDRDAFREIAAHEVVSGQHLRLTRWTETRERQTLYVVIKEIKPGPAGLRFVVKSNRTANTTFRLTKVFILCSGVNKLNHCTHDDRMYGAAGRVDDHPRRSGSISQILCACRRPAPGLFWLARPQNVCPG